MLIRLLFSVLKKIEEGQDMLDGKMSPQLAAELDYQRYLTLKAILMVQLTDFSRE